MLSLLHHSFLRVRAPWLGTAATYALALAILALGLAACGDSPTEPDLDPDPTPSPNEITITIEGVVLSEDEQEPIEGAEVVAYDGESELASTISDEEGAYAMSFSVAEDEAPGEVRLEAEADGYIAFATTLDVAETISYDVEMELDGTRATVSGTVTDEDTGAPLEEATVTGTDAATDDTLFVATTDVSGEYQITFVVADEPDEVTISAEAEGYQPAEATASFSEDLMVDLELEAQLYAGGTGTPDNPYQIATLEQLQAMNEALDAHFVLIADIDASATAQWNGGRGFEPIGHWEDKAEDLNDPAHTPFTGSFDGGDHTIFGLTIDRADEIGVGLFALVDEAKIENVTLTDVTMYGSGAGALAGVILNGTVIRNVHTSGELGGSGTIGGLVAGSYRTEIHHSSAEAMIEDDGGGAVGGLLGADLGATHIYSSHASGHVTSSSSDTGGLAGWMQPGGQVHDSYATGNVATSEYGGGLIGYAQGVEIHNSHATGAVTGSRQIGGLVGRSQDGGEIHNSFATGTVSGNQDTGGLIGWAGDTIVRNSYAEGDVSASVVDSGGLIGRATGGTDIRASYATGSVSANERAGGMVGRLTQSSTVRDSYARGDVTGDKDVGGLVGSILNSSLIETYATGGVTGADNVGGFVGENQGTIINGYWDVDASDQSEGAGAGDSSGTTGLPTDEMTGSDADQNMSGFDFDQTWIILTGDYPILRWQE